MSTREWVPRKRFRVCKPDGSTWAETSDEAKARAVATRRRRPMEQLWEKPVEYLWERREWEWRTMAATDTGAP